MDHETCHREREWGVLTESLKNLNEFMRNIDEKVMQHIREGEEKGGFRERILLLEVEKESLEKEIIELKKELIGQQAAFNQRLQKTEKGYWIAAVGGGLIGGSLREVVPEIFKLFVSLFKAL